MAATVEYVLPAPVPAPALTTVKELCLKATSKNLRRVGGEVGRILVLT